MSKYTAKSFAFLCSLLIALSLISGCTGNPDKKPSNNDVPDGISDDVVIEELEGTTVTYVTWKDPDLNEDGLAVERFEEKYGIDVNIQLVSQSGYVNTIAADVAAGTQGDVFFENGTFPGSLNVMQPLDAARLDLSDPIWNQALIKASTLDGHPYLVDAVSNVWTEVDICVYNTNLFESNGIKTPQEYYDEGKWTFENFRFAAKEISKLSKDYCGAGILGEIALGAAGSSFFTYKDNQMHVTVDDKLMDAMNFLAQMKADGIIKLDRSGFKDGKQGMALTNCFGLKKTGYFPNFNPDYLAATYLPVWKEGDEQMVTGIYRGWGLIDGAKNPLAAGLFLREYLDVNNYDLGNTFHNQEVANFFFQVTGTYSENMIYYLGLRSTTGTTENFAEAWNKNSPANTKTYIESKLNVMQEMCNKSNDIIDKERKWIKEAEENGTINKVN